jgi:hypothetical protein
MTSAFQNALYYICCCGFAVGPRYRDKFQLATGVRIKCGTAQRKLSPAVFHQNRYTFFDVFFTHASRRAALKSFFGKIVPVEIYTSQTKEQRTFFYILDAKRYV